MKPKIMFEKYGIWPEERQVLFVKQRGRCAICGKPENECKRALHIDHDHATKKVRGLLCFYCNRHRVGRLNLYWAEKVYNYLKKAG